MRRLMPLVFSLLYLLKTLSCFSQQSVTQYSYEYEREYHNNSFFSGMVELPDSGFFVIGSSFANAGSVPVVTRLDKKGNVVWSNEYYTPWGTSSCYGREIVLTPDGGAIFSIESVPGTGTSHMDVIRISSAGSVIWSESIYFNGANYTLSEGLAVMPDGTYTVVGDEWFAQQNCTIVNFDINGTILHSERINAGPNSSLRFVKTDAQGNIFVCGKAKHYSTSLDAIFVAKLAPDLSIRWSYGYQLGYPVNPTAFLVSGEGDIYVNAFLDSANYSSWAPCLLKLDSTGNVAWSNKVSGPWTVSEIFSLAELPDKSILIAHEPEYYNMSGSQFVMADIAPSGTLQWSKLFFPSQFAIPMALLVTQDHCIAAAGEVDLYSSQRAFFMKTDTTYDLSNCNSDSGVVMNLLPMPCSRFSTGTISASALSNPYGTTIVAAAYTTQLGCIDSSSYFVSVPDPPLLHDSIYSGVTIQNVFSPNGDGVNDIFIPAQKNIVGSSFMIFDRWGNRIFATEENGVGWNGTNANGTECSEGTYYYVFDGTGVDGKNYPLRGFVILVR